MKFAPTIAIERLESVRGGARWGRILRDVGTAALELWGGEQLPRVEQPNLSSPPGQHDTRPAPKWPDPPKGVKIPPLRRR